jgi:hypothetical protein
MQTTHAFSLFQTLVMVICILLCYFQQGTSRTDDLFQ